MDEFVKRADQADALLKSLKARVEALEKGGAASGSKANYPAVAMTKKAKQHMKAEVTTIQAELKKLTQRNAKLEAENKKLKGLLQKAGQNSGGKKEKQLQNQIQASKKNEEALEDIKKHLEKFREEVKVVVAERDALKAQVSGGIPSSMTEDQIGFITNKLLELRQKVTDFLGKKENLAQAVSPTSAASSAGTAMTMETIKERKHYTVTGDLKHLKKLWFEAELGELDDEDFEGYLSRKVYAVDVEEDDDTVKVRFDNHDTQWFPVGCLFSLGDAPKAAAPKAQPSGAKRMTMETIKERQHYYITRDLEDLKKLWYEAELGELDDEDFEGYLGRKVYGIDIEEDDDTIKVRFDNHDSQWFPVTSLFDGEPPASAKPAASASTGTKQTMDTIKERKFYVVTSDLAELKKEWFEAELGQLDDEDFEGYLGRVVKAVDIEEDDDTINCRFDNQNTQWFPVTVLSGPVDGY